MPSITLRSGATFTGTEAEVAAFIKAMRIDLSGTSGYYYSESKEEWVPIVAMHSDHLKNAILKIYRAWVENLSKFPAVDLPKKIAEGPADSTLVALFTELAKRK